VRFFFQRLRETGRDIRDLKGVRLAAIGPATASTLEGMGLRVDLVRETYLRKAWVQALFRQDIGGRPASLSPVPRRPGM
jgi:uroporphyrinogen III methyltransferase/synthase